MSAGFEPTLNVADTLYSGGFLGGVDYYREHHFQSKEALTYTHDSNSIKIGAEFEPIWFSAQTPYFTPGVGIFSPQSFFGAGPLAAGPGTAVEFLFQQPRSEFQQQVPQRALPFRLASIGPDAALRENADDVAFWHKLLASTFRINGEPVQISHSPSAFATISISFRQRAIFESSVR